jgi:hypothetical protein
VRASHFGSQASRRVDFCGRRGVAAWYRLLARVLRRALVWCIASSLAVIANISVAASVLSPAASNDLRLSGGVGPPDLVFACDGLTSELDSLFSQPLVISDLQALNSGVALDLPDLTTDRARLVRRLNDAGISVTAWLALPKEQGYYLNASNPQEAAARFADFEKWSAANGLRWARVGLDIEPNIQEFGALKQGSKWRLISTLAVRYFEVERVRRAKIAYSALIREIQAHGYRVQTYQFPFMADERAVRTTLLERLAGVLDLKSDQEVLMTYTSFNHKLDSALISAYGADAQAIAVGSTVGSDADPQFVPLNWEEFSRDLKVANHFSHTIGVYNLKGCVRQGFLSRLKTVNWNEQVTIPAESVRQATRFRVRVQRILWIGSHLLYFIAMILTTAAVIVALWNRRRHPQQETTG